MCILTIVAEFLKKRRIWEQLVFKSLLLQIPFRFIVPELGFFNIKGSGIYHFSPASLLPALLFLFSIGCTNTLPFTHSLRSPEMCKTHQMVYKLFNRHLRMHGTALLIKRRFGLHRVAYQNGREAQSASSWQFKFFTSFVTEKKKKSPSNPIQFLKKLIISQMFTK